MIGNMQPLELRHFLRFVTGASVAPKIEITFNSLSGLACRPIAHTCGFNLELSTAYTNYDDFYGDLKSVPTSTSEESSWRMDALGVSVLIIEFRLHHFHSCNQTLI